MLYRIGMYIIALIFLFSTQALAHSVVKDSNPKPGEVIKADLKEITIVFSTKVEKSEMDLENEKGEIFIPKISMNHDVVKGILDTPLPNGKYTLHWDIIGADGHPIKNKYEFEVAIPVSTSSPAPAPEPIQKIEPEPIKEEPKQVEPTKTVEDNTPPMEKKSSSSFATLVVVIFVALVGFGSLIWLMRRKL